jgi:hypothetical protein
MSVRIKAAAVIFIASIFLGLVSTYFYGKFFSHPRYWEGTIKRVVLTEVDLINDMQTELTVEQPFPTNSDSIDRMFSSLSGKIAIEILFEGQVIWSNKVKEYQVGNLLKEIPMSDGRVMSLSAYTPPAWRSQFIRWLKQPTRWFEPSFDFISFPFLCFTAIYLLSLTTIAFVTKASYLEKDAMKMLEILLKRNDQ